MKKFPGTLYELEEKIRGIDWDMAHLKSGSKKHQDSALKRSLLLGQKRRGEYLTHAEMYAKKNPKKKVDGYIVKTSSGSFFGVYGDRETAARARDKIRKHGDADGIRWRGLKVVPIAYSPDWKKPIIELKGNPPAGRARRKKSKGHIEFIGPFEFYERGGEVYKAPIGAIFDTSGYRQGRWETGSKRHFKQFRDVIKSGILGNPAGRPSSRRRNPSFLVVANPAGGRARKKTTRRARANPRRPIIGDEALSLTYRGGDGKRKSKRPWIHKFESPVQIIGNKDGSITLRSVDGLRLWDMF